MNKLQSIISAKLFVEYCKMLIDNTNMNKEQKELLKILLDAWFENFKMNNAD